MILEWLSVFALCFLTAFAASCLVWFAVLYFDRRRRIAAMRWSLYAHESIARHPSQAAHRWNGGPVPAEDREDWR